MFEEIFNDEQEHALERMLGVLRALDLINEADYCHVRLAISLSYYLYHRDERW